MARANKGRLSPCPRYLRLTLAHRIRQPDVVRLVVASVGDGLNSMHQREWKRELRTGLHFDLQEIL